MLAAGLGAAGSLGGGILGANAQEETNKTNQFINIMNSMMRERERRDAIEAAGVARREDKLGGIDAAGNRTYFDPEKGWVVAPSSKSEELQNLAEKEQAKQLYEDLPMKRRQMQRNYADQLEDRSTEKKYLDELKYAKVDPETIRGMLFKDAQQGISGSFDEATSSAMRGATRRGMDPSNILAAFARQKSDATGDAYSKTGAQAMQMAEEMTKGRQGQLTNLINFFGGRARGLPAVQMPNVQGNAQADASLKGFSGLAQNTQEPYVRAMGGKGGSFDYTPANMGFANSVTQAGQLIGNMFKTQYDGRSQGGNVWNEKQQ
jgi:hypothetical protein